MTSLLDVRAQTQICKSRENSRTQEARAAAELPVCLSVCLSVGRAMRLQGWVSLTNQAAGLVSSAARRQRAARSSQKHVCLFGRSAANMAEGAKKLAAYAAVDNHVQVWWTVHPRWLLANDTNVVTACWVVLCN